MRSQKYYQKNKEKNREKNGSPRMQWLHTRRVLLIHIIWIYNNNTQYALYYDFIYILCNNILNIVVI